MGAVWQYLAKQPFVLLFLVVAAGYALGRLKVKGIGLGATASTLLIGLLVSAWAFERQGTAFALPEFASALFFNLFMFAIGMKVGPQFLSGLRRDAGKFIFLAVLVPVLALGLALVIKVVFNPPPGVLPGIFAGANTATPGLGAAQDAYASGLGAGAAVSRAELSANLSTAFALSYCLSVVLFVVMLKLTTLSKADPVAAAARYDASIRKAGAVPLPGSAQAFFTGQLPVALRTFRLEQPDLLGHRLGELRRTYPTVSIERVFRGREVLQPDDGIVLQPNDAVALYGPISRLISAAPHLGPEIETPTLKGMHMETADVVAHGPRPRKLEDIAKDVGHGLYLNAVFRAGEQIPHGPDTVLHNGDVVRVTGPAWRIGMLEKTVGHVVRPSLATDVVTLALGLTAGGLLGSISVSIGAVKLTLGTSVALLLVGIVLSTLRTRNPELGGPFPEPARALLEDLGLNVFVAILGLNAGAGLIAAVEGGAVGPVLLGCLLVGFVPPIIAWFVGRKLLKMNVALLMGAVAGARCSSPGLQAGMETTQSAVPAISYPVTFAIASVLVTIMSYVLAAMA